MNSELEFYAQLTRKSSFAVLAFANPDCTSFEFIRLRPYPFSEVERAKLMERAEMESWEDRGLDEVGVLGLVDGMPQSALTKISAPDEYSRLMEEFRLYVQSFIDIGFKTFDERVIQRGLCEQREEKAASEIAELERMLALPDLR